ncbi:MAG: VanW family protein [Patescibacteria group bacterium]
MEFDALKQKVKPPYWLVVTLTIFLVLIIVWGVVAIVLQEIYNGKFYPGISVGGINLSGMTYVEANDKLQEKTNILNENGFIFRYERKEANVFPVQVSTTDPDLSYELYSMNFNDQLTYAFGLGREYGVFSNFFTRIKLLFIQNKIPIRTGVNRIEIKNILSTNFDELLIEAKETNIEYFNNEPVFVIGKQGEKIDYDKYIQTFSEQLEFFEFKSIELEKENYDPKISLTVAEELLPDINLTLERQEFFVKATITRSWFKKSLVKEWVMQKETIKEGLELKWNEEQKQTYLGFNEEKFYDFLKPAINEVEIEARNAKFEIDNGRVKEFQSSQDGIEIDFEQTLKTFENKLIDLNENTIYILTASVPAMVDTKDVNELGITKLIGIGKSSFAGSPYNRMHNIGTGAEAINGLILKPGDEFSTNQALGAINAATGYLPELVIKGNKTIPEYGGGLCQIATTMFRLALDTGLPITERYPHAYRVGYYEPAGTDATIYSPHPDFRFTNDTTGNILLQTKVEGTNLVFEFWGQDDGREVIVGYPVIYNITSPGPTKYLETEDLEPGETDCTESAHNGAEANLKRTILYSDGEIKEDNFYSKYRPWQAVCLVGIDPTTQATSTEEVLP